MVLATALLVGVSSKIHASVLSLQLLLLGLGLGRRDQGSRQLPILGKTGEGEEVSRDIPRGTLSSFQLPQGAILCI